MCFMLGLISVWIQSVAAWPRRPVSPNPRNLIKFKIDSDGPTNDYAVWLKIFPDIWIEKFS